MPEPLCRDLGEDIFFHMGEVFSSLDRSLCRIGEGAEDDVIENMWEHLATSLGD